MTLRPAATLILILFCVGTATAQSPPSTEGDYYKLQPFAIPAGISLEAGELEFLPDGRLAVSTRRGEIWLVERPFATDLEKEPTFTLFASGLHEVLGLAWRDSWLYVTQRCELSRLKDTSGDGKADLFETVSDGWEINGDYHEYAFGSKFDREGNIWVVLCLTGSFDSKEKFRGWCLRVSADGKLTPTCSGIRSPGGIGANAAGDMFYTDNQGPWNGACTLKHLAPGSFQGHPAGNVWYDFAKNLGPRPIAPVSGSRMMVEAKRIPQLMPPAVYFPYPKMGQSSAGIACDTTKGKFGPFGEQLFVADQSASTVNRVCLEKVNGRYQGACIPFRAGFGSGALSVLFAESGEMFVGGTNRGWGSRGTKPFSLDRLTWTGKTPFELHEIHALPDGFELSFTEPLDPATAKNPKSYRLSTYTYIYQSTYGSPEVDPTTPGIKSIELSPNGKRLVLSLSEMAEGHVHEFHLDGLRSAAGRPLLHQEAYYTLNYVPD